MNLNIIFKKVKILIVTFKSHKIIESCIENINKNFNILVVENSNDKNFTKHLEKKYPNVNCINIGYDSGFGSALNRGIKFIDTEYFISINPDSFPEKNCLETIINTAINNKNVDLVTPITLIKNGSKEFDDYGYFEKKKEFKNSKNLLSVDWVNGNVFLAKKKLFEELGYFDENFFLEYDERDFQRRMYKNKKKILIDFNAKSHHLLGKSADQKYAFEMKCEACWHHGWSRYYYYKKHDGFFYSLYMNIPFAIKNLLKSIIWKILGSKNKSKFYKLYFAGFIHSLFNKKSTYRALKD